jgi:hypothetical protein
MLEPGSPDVGTCSQRMYATAMVIPRGGAHQQITVLMKEAGG